MFETQVLHRSEKIPTTCSLQTSIDSDNLLLFLSIMRSHVLREEKFLCNFAKKRNTKDSVNLTKE